MLSGATAKSVGLQPVNGPQTGLYVTELLAASVQKEVAPLVLFHCRRVLPSPATPMLGHVQPVKGPNVGLYVAAPLAAIDQTDAEPFVLVQSRRVAPPGAAAI